ncbi:MAG: 3'(2'),5'-bisphosphate nucleotidase CysQ, partial [Hyphomonadaceae bacterium]
NIALVENATPVMGVVYAPERSALYAGEPGRALKGLWDARANEERAPLAPIAVAPGASPWRVTASRRSGGPRINDFIARIAPIEEKRASSSVKFCLIAEGAADLYPRFGEISEWDAAAGHAVLVAAGGGVMRTDDQTPLRYGRAAQRFAIDGFVAYGGEASERTTRETLALMRTSA